MQRTKRELNMKVESSTNLSGAAQKAEVTAEDLRRVDTSLAQVGPDGRRRVATSLAQKLGDQQFMDPLVWQAFLEWISGAVTLEDVAETAKKCAADVTGKKGVGDLKVQGKGVQKGTAMEGDLDLCALLEMMQSQIVNSLLEEIAVISSKQNPSGPKQSSLGGQDQMDSSSGGEAAPTEVPTLTVLPTE
ncbi:hypothetical protein ACFL6C_01620 [Myxococcota bacterium]